MFKNLENKRLIIKFNSEIRSIIEILDDPNVQIKLRQLHQTKKIIESQQVG